MEGTSVDCCVLFADIAGSTRMYSRHGDEATRTLLESCLDLMAGVVERSGGRVVRRIGDELLCLVPTTDAAATMASALHSAVSDAHATGRFPWAVRLRIGLEFGPVIESGGALFGQTVHTAARVASMAKAGQTLTTRASLDRLNAALRCFTRFHDSVVLKGQAGEQEVHELVWSVSQSTVPHRPPPGTRAADPVRAVELTYRGTSYRVSSENPRLEIGRDPSCDLPVAGDAVSKLHARILWDRGRVHLEDISTNGTVIERDTGRRLAIHREKAGLTGSGVLQFGDEPDDGGARVGYRCEQTDL